MNPDQTAHLGFLLLASMTNLVQSAPHIYSADENSRLHFQDKLVT